MKKILFVNQDTIPYVDETEQARLGMQIPNKLQDNDCEIRTFMPLWGNINERRGQLHEVIRLSGLNIPICDYDHQLIIKVASIPQTKLQVYFIDNDDFFARKAQTVDAEGKPFSDNDERAAFFARGVIETIKKLHWIPDYIICNGWMSAMLPILVREAYKSEPAIAEAKIITCIYNETPEAVFNKVKKEALYFNSINADLLHDYSDIMNETDIVKIAIDYSDGIIAALPDSYEPALSYAREQGKRVMDYVADDSAASYNAFIESL
ncbi:MAG: glycogen/starch synthase [Prevotella sp.]|nr:glycogen/starch synthase [Prevotella sp.]